MRRSHLDTKEMSMSFAPYLNFDGDCAEAFAFYADTFGGTIAYQSTFGEAASMPGMPPLNDEDKRRIMHAQIQLKGGLLMGSDALAGADEACGGGYRPPQGMWVSVQADDAEQGRRFFDALAKGGEVAMPYADTFWSDGFGMVKDRFGIPWMVNVPKKEG